MFDWFILVGIIIFLNLLPGIHANLVAAILSLYFSPEQIAFALGMHFILSILPSMIYGVSQEIASAPLITRLNKYKAFYIFALSALFSALIALFVNIPFYHLYSLLKPYIFWIVLLITFIFFIGLQPESKFMFLITGIWGLFALDNNLFSIFSGLFAVPFLLFHSKKSEQHDDAPFSLLSILPGIILGAFSLLLPGVSPPSVIASLIPIFKSYDFLAYYASISSMQYILSIDNYNQTKKLRNAYVKFINTPNAKYYMILGIVLGIILMNILIRLDIPYYSQSRYVLLFVIFLLSYWIDSYIGVISLIFSSFLGILSYKLKASSPSLLGIIILPTLLLLARYLG